MTANQLPSEPLLSDSRFAEFCARRATQMPDSVLPLSDAIFEYDLGIHGLPRSIPSGGKPIASMLQMIGRTTDVQWLFVLPTLQYFRLSKASDPLSSYVDNVLVHRMESGRMLYDVQVLDLAAIEVLSSNFLRQTGSNAQAAIDEETASECTREWAARRPRPLDLIGQENQRRVSAGVALARINDEAKVLLKWSKEYQPDYVATFANDAACIASIRTHLYKMQRDWSFTVVLPLTN